jgi:hypothetical protein
LTIKVTVFTRMGYKAVYNVCVCVSLWLKFLHEGKVPVERPEPLTFWNNESLIHYKGVLAYTTLMKIRRYQIKEEKTLCMDRKLLNLNTALFNFCLIMTGC